MNILKKLFWIAVALLGALALGTIASARGEHLNAVWLVVAAACIFMLGYRFYSRFLALRVVQLDDRRATPAERLEDGRDFVLTNKWVVFGQHFAAIAGPGPLVGPILAAQFGYLPGTLWIVIGGVLGGAVQDFVTLFCSVRRDGKSLGQMAKEEIGSAAGFTSLFAVLCILVILLAAVALVVVNALKSSPWGLFTVAMTIPIAVLMGIYVRYLRPGRVMEASIIGFLLVFASVLGGRYIADSHTLAPLFTYAGPALALMVIFYGFAASVLPVWLLLAPRGYISTFVKLGVIFLLAVGILAAHATNALAALHALCRWDRPHFRRKNLPLLLHYHRLRRHFRIPFADLIRHHSEDAQPGKSCAPGRLWQHVDGVFRRHDGHGGGGSPEARHYFAVNSPAGIVGALRRGGRHHFGLGLSGHHGTICRTSPPASANSPSSIARGERPRSPSAWRRSFPDVLGGRAVMGIWYHFAIMFEALFILTISTPERASAASCCRSLRAFLEAAGQHGLVSGHHSLQRAYRRGLGIFPFPGCHRSVGRDQQPLAAFRNFEPTSGDRSAVRLHHHSDQDGQMAVHAGSRLCPLGLARAVTMTASYQKIFAENPRVGFLSHARALAAQVASGAIPASQAAATSRLIFNDRLDAAVTGIFAVLVVSHPGGVRTPVVVIRHAPQASGPE